MTANNGYTFTGLISAKINGNDATVIYNNGSTVLISYVFPATDPVTTISNRYLAFPYKGIDKIKYMYSYDGYDFYYIYLGQMANIPLFYFSNQIHGGSPSEYKVTITEEIRNSVGNTVSDSIQTTRGVITDHTLSKSSGEKIGFEISTKYKFLSLNGEIKIIAEADWRREVSNTTTNSIEKTTSLTETQSDATEYAKSTMEERTFPLTVENHPPGIYRFTMFGISDVYLYVIYDPTTDELYHEFREYVIQNKKDAYGWALDYAENTDKIPFNKMDATDFEFDILFLDNLPKPTLDLSTVNDPTFFTFSAFETWLTRMPDNTATNPYKVKLNVNSLAGIKDTLLENPNKYISLDLSDMTITTIPDCAFGDELLSNRCTTLTGIILPDSVTSIGDHAFRACNNLVSVNIPNNGKSIGNYAFFSCSLLDSVTIPNSVTSVGNSVFNYCTSLTSVTIGSGVTKIGKYAFSSCRSLEAINVSSNNNVYASENGVLYNKNKTILHRYPAKGTSTNFSIPNSVTSIEEFAFEGCTILTSVTIPDSVTIIGNEAFISSTSLTSVTIGSGVNSIGTTAFGLCTNLISITIPKSVRKI
jgi:hypothetical protein